MAYENVKNTWTKREIWNRRWGILPGMSWKHEGPLGEESANGPAQANSLGNGTHERENHLPDVFLGPLLPLNQIIAKRPAS
jgi:hypothetical protein